MRSLRVLFAAAFALVLLVSAVPIAAAQLQVVDTTIEITVDLLGEGTTLDPGDQAEGFILGNFCWAQGGFSPLDGEIVITAAQVSPEQDPPWLDVRITGGTERRFELPFGPELKEEGDCVSFDTFGLRITATREAPYDATHSLTFIVTGKIENDPGTYNEPTAQTAGGEIRISPDPGGEEELPDFDAPPPPPPEVETSPVGPFMFVVVTVFALARLRGRRI